MRRVRRSFRVLSVLAAATVGGATLAGAAGAQTPLAAKPATATAIIIDTAGHKVGGLKLTDTKTGLSIKGDIRQIPSGDHAIHLNAVGKCDQPLFASAGSIFNPTNKEHGLSNPRGPELGDLKNIRAIADADYVGAVNPNGAASVNLLAKGVTLTGTNGILGPNGASIVIDAYPDDYKSQPAGNSGDHIACGVIMLDTPNGG